MLFEAVKRSSEHRCSGSAGALRRPREPAFCTKDYCGSSVIGGRMIFRKRISRGKPFCKRFSPGTPFRKLLYDCGGALVWRQVYLPAHELMRHISGDLLRWDRDGFLAKEPLEIPAEQEKQSIAKKIVRRLVNHSLSYSRRTFTTSV